MIWVIIGAFILAIAVAPFAFEARKSRPSGKAYDAAPGALAKLTDGKTYYEWHGPVDGDVLVCVHGLSTPSFIWDGLVRNLTTMGYRVLTYDLYGRGLSDAPPRPQTREFFLRQLRELLAHEGVQEYSLLGYSMGGQIAIAQTAEEPEFVERLILLAPAGFAIRATAVTRMVRDRGWIGDWLFFGLGGRKLRRQNNRLAGVETAVPDLARRQNAQLDQKGYLTSVLSSMRHMLADDAEKDMAEIQRAHVPVLAIWGEKDAQIQASAVGCLAKVNRDARHATIAGASHWLPATHPGEVSRAIVEFRRDT
ncbi:alpha/beta fold hydrolase [Aliiroseovarius sp. PTFE2010]|uniref:alpha/beta fold hydrolase n=1 Tax=Aliiroseovarius sp. PTFE2010 TaxID=3417190 RepID=UPI003CE84F82